MRLLVLGGGGFLGYHAVVEAVAAGHEVTVLSRSGSAPVDGVEVLTGDRMGDLSSLRDREWDGVFDTFNDTREGAPAIAETARLLSEAVASIAMKRGATHLKAQMLEDNAPMRKLFERLGRTVRTVEDGTSTAYVRLRADRRRSAA